jgi:ABC-type cobalt transport system substrate-binding protein
LPRLPEGEKEGGGKDQENGKEIEEVDQHKPILKTVYEDLSSLVGALAHLTSLSRPGEVLLILEADAP